jgi:hypothetical protein
MCVYTQRKKKKQKRKAVAAGGRDSKKVYTPMVAQKASPRKDSPRKTVTT